MLLWSRRASRSDERVKDSECVATYFPPSIAVVASEAHNTTTVQRCRMASHETGDKQTRHDLFSLVVRLRLNAQTINGRGKVCAQAVKTVSVVGFIYVVEVFDGFRLCVDRAWRRPN